METERFLRPAITPRPRTDPSYGKKKKKRGGKDGNCCRVTSAVIGVVLFMAGLATLLVVSNWIVIS